MPSPSINEKLGRKMPVYDDGKGHMVIDDSKANIGAKWKKRRCYAHKQVFQKKFANELIKSGGNVTQAMLATRPMKYDSARNLGAKIVKRPEIQEEIIKALEAQGIDYNYVLSKRKRCVETGEKLMEAGPTMFKDASSEMSKHLSGMEGVLKLLGERDTSSNFNVHKHLHLNQNASHNELLEKRKELNNWFTDILEVEEIKKDK